MRARVADVDPMSDEPQPQLSWLSKCALVSSFALAIGIWFLTTDKDGNLPAPPVTHVAARKHAATSTDEPEAPNRSAGGRGAGRHRGLARAELRQARQRAEAEATASEPSELEAKSRQVREAATDPTSMFDMSTP